MWRFRGLDVRGVADVTRLMTMSIMDILDRFFETDQVKTVMALNGLIGTWAGPYEPGTGYVMAHHSIGDVGDGHLGAWATPIGGMGAVSDALASSARSFGAEIRMRGAGRADPHRRRPGRAASSLARRRGAHARRSSSPRRTRRSRSCASSTPRELPADFVDDIETGSSRSGTVKINLALDRAPVFTAKPDHEDFTGGMRARALDRVPRDGVRGGARRAAATAPFSDGVMPTFHDPTLAPEGKHIVSLFTQWVPHGVGRRARRRGARGLRRPRDRRLRRARARASPTRSCTAR